MHEFHTIEPAIDPSNRLTFLLDWELTMKCNLDCSYCETGLYGGHDNSTKHPPLTECLHTIDFLYEYVDLYLQRRPKGLRYAVLNVYGGESLHHPNILEILKQVRSRHAAYAHSWHLTVTTTTNLIIPAAKLLKISQLVDEFTVSYHCENNHKQKTLFKNNIKLLQQQGCKIKCIVLMHSEPELFADAEQMINWCKQNQVAVLPRQLDHKVEHTQFNYNDQQVVWFDRFYKSRNKNTEHQVEFKKVADKYDLAKSGRSCCGGRLICGDQNFREKTSYVTNYFPGWYCSVNEFFVYVKQVTKEIFVNKDCKMNFQGTVGAIGTLDRSHTLIQWTRSHLTANTLPVIQCAKSFCACGLCAPKADNQDLYHKIMVKYKQ